MTLRGSTLGCLGQPGPSWLLACVFFRCVRSVCTSDAVNSVNWYSPSRRPLRRPPESPFNGRYEDYDYACSYGDRLPAPSPVYSRQGYVQHSTLGTQCDWYARGDGDGHFEPDRFQDNGLQATDGRSPYRQYDESVKRSRDPLGSYYDEDVRFMDGGSFGYGGETTPRLTDGQTRRNGGIGFDWTSTAPDRKSAYQDDSLLIIGESGIYSSDNRSPFDYNVGTVQRRAGKTSSSPYDDLRTVDGMERRLPVGTESGSETSYRKEKDRLPRESPHRTGASSSAAASGKNGTRSRTKVDDIQRLTERDRGPAAQNRKQQQNHVTPRGDQVDEATTTKQSRGRGHKSSTTPSSTTSGQCSSKLT